MQMMPSILFISFAQSAVMNGKPEKGPEEEKALRKKIVGRALKLMAAPIESQTVIDTSD